MNDEDRDARWQAILEAQAEIIAEPVPLDSARSGRSNHRSSSKSARFDEALSGLGSWSSVQPTDRRMSA